MAARYAEPLVIVYATAPPGGMGEEFSPTARRSRRSAAPAVGHAVRQAAERGVGTVVELVADKPVEALLEEAERHGATVIVVGTWGESPLRGAILGSTPHKLLHLSTSAGAVRPAPEETSPATHRQE